MTERHCSGCTLCCKLIPMPEFHKPANVRCPHQTHKGCNIYAQRPMACAVWTCRWLANDDTAELARPDRSRYVIDVMPDFVTVTDETGRYSTIEVVQIWCDPKHPKAWHDSALLDYIERRGKEGKLALIRFGSHEAI